MKGYLETHSEEVLTMLALEWDIDEAKKAWHADGFEDALENVAIKMLIKGKSLDEIQEITEIPIERIKELAVTLNKSFKN